MCGKNIKRRKTEPIGKYNKRELCSPECRIEATRKKRPPRTCTVCGKEYVRNGNKQGASNYAKSLFCSPKCFYESRRTVLKDKYCEYCGKKFSRIRDEVNKRCVKDWIEQRFCSRTCAGKAKTIDKEKRCEYCGELFSRGDKEDARRFVLRRFCSVKCSHALRAEKLYGSLLRRECLLCGRELTRKLGPKSPESNARFAIRKFCNLRCKGIWAHVQAENRRSAKDAAKKLVEKPKATARSTATANISQKELSLQHKRDVLSVAASLRG